MNPEKTIAVLNSLIEINNDRIYGYEKAYKELEDKDLKIMFSNAIETSIKFKSQLVSAIISLGEKKTESSTTSGKIDRIGMDITPSVTSNSKKIILDSCAFYEDAAIQTYTNALGKNLTTALIMMIGDQLLLIVSNHHSINKVRNLMALYNQTSFQ